MGSRDSAGRGVAVMSGSFTSWMFAVKRFVKTDGPILLGCFALAFLIYTFSNSLRQGAHLAEAAVDHERRISRLEAVQELKSGKAKAPAVPAGAIEL